MTSCLKWIYTLGVRGNPQLGIPRKCVVARLLGSVAVLCTFSLTPFPMYRNWVLASLCGCSYLTVLCSASVCELKGGNMPPACMAWPWLISGEAVKSKKHFYAVFAGTTVGRAWDPETEGLLLPLLLISSSASHFTNFSFSLLVSKRVDSMLSDISLEHQDWIMIHSVAGTVLGIRGIVLMQNKVPGETSVKLVSSQPY